MNHNVSFVLLAATLLFITSCSSPQQKPTNVPQPPSSITDTTRPTSSAQPPSSAITDKAASQRVMVPTPYIPKSPPSKTKPAKKVLPITKTVPQKALKKAVKKVPKEAHQPSMAKPSNLVKRKPASQTKPTPKTTTTQTKTPSAVPTSPPEVNFSLEALPLTMGLWTLNESKYLKSQCSLASITNNMPDGQGNTPVYLEITRQNITFHTKSNIDTSYTGTGLFFGQQKAIPLEKLHTPTSARFETNYEAIVSAMKNHSSLEIKVGFWPSWPVTQAYAITLKTEGFKTAYNALKKCDSML